jgi:hypothetical protein
MNYFHCQKTVVHSLRNSQSYFECKTIVLIELSGAPGSTPQLLHSFPNSCFWNGHVDHVWASKSFPHGVTLTTYGGLLNTTQAPSMVLQQELYYVISSPPNLTIARSTRPLVHSTLLGKGPCSCWGKMTGLLPSSFRHQDSVLYSRWFAPVDHNHLTVYPWWSSDIPSNLFTGPAVCNQKGFYRSFYWKAPRDDVHGVPVILVSFRGVSAFFAVPYGWENLSKPFSWWGGGHTGSKKYLPRPLLGQRWRCQLESGFRGAPHGSWFKSFTPERRYISIQVHLSRLPGKQIINSLQIIND